MKPDDLIADLRRQLAASQESNATLQRMLERQGYQLDRMQDQLERTLRELEALRRHLRKPPPDDTPAGPAAGPGASTPNLASPTPNPVGPTPGPAGPKPPRKKKSSFGRNVISPGIPRIEDKQTVDTCACGVGHPKVLREEAVEYYDYIPAKVVIRKVIRTVCRCNICRRIVTAPFPEDLLPRLRATPALLANIIFEKHGRSLSLHRVDQELRRLGATIPAVTRDSWLEVAARLLERLLPALKLRLFQPGLMHSDGTGFEVIEPNQGTRLGQMTVYASTGAVYYTFTPTKEGFHQRRFLGLEGIDGKAPPATTPRFTGYLVCDAASTADRSFRATGIQECGCNAHARRGFEAAETTDRRLATEGIAFWTALYAVERRATREKLDAAGRLRLRQELSAPMVRDLRAWIDQHRGTRLPKDPLTLALNYAHNHWEALTRFMTDGRIPLDNNWAERLLKRVAVGRHNYLFAGSDRGAERSAIFFTFIASSQLHGVDPVAWLTAVLPRIATTRPSQLVDLLPDGWRVSGAAEGNERQAA